MVRRLERYRIPGAEEKGPTTDLLREALLREALRPSAPSEYTAQGRRLWWWLWLLGAGIAAAWLWFLIRLMPPSGT
jgi:hypothetical protein